MSVFDDSFDKVLKVEAGYTNNPNDKGGPTNWGITQFVARANGYNGDMKNLTKDEAKKIYKAQYWNTLRLDDIGALSAKIANEMFDTSVNMGTGVAGKFLQRALNVLNQNGSLFPDMVVDGLVGPKTVLALQLFIQKRGTQGEDVILKALNAQQGVRYIEIAEANPTQETFEYGWLANRL